MRDKEMPHAGGNRCGAGERVEIFYTPIYHEIKKFRANNGR